ncbi:MAG: hypothetical protein CSA33_04755 [Desulfobulbus propionicus]|nr:MAG: hypothetical protein CSA33_04755 [Desulfobulbus propionicus]
MRGYHRFVPIANSWPQQESSPLSGPALAHSNLLVHLLSCLRKETKQMDVVSASRLKFLQNVYQRSVQARPSSTVF